MCIEGFYLQQAIADQRSCMSLFDSTFKQFKASLVGTSHTPAGSPTCVYGVHVRLWPRVLQVHWHHVGAGENLPRLVVITCENDNDN